MVAAVFLGVGHLDCALRPALVVVMNDKLGVGPVQ